jgi:hypothetical protein
MIIRFRVLVLMAAFAVAGPAWAGPVAWVEMTGRGAEARLVTDAASCPTISINGRRRAMHERAAPSQTFPNRECAAALPTSIRRASVAGIDLPVPKRRPSRLVIFGDSGCRLKGKVTQHCNDPGGWPFAKVAALAAARRPDLVIHVGDYYYRETPCPTGQTACAGSPYGDKWQTWQAELFAPAAPLLAVAPWVFTRGNHEDCHRGGAGWFRLLDAAATPKDCPAVAASFSVRVNGARLLIVDSADTEDASAPPDKVTAFAARLAGLNEGRRAEPLWIVTHRPFWYAARTGDSLTDGIVNATERAAASAADLSAVQLVLSGHVHDFTSLDFAGARPPQLIVGTGGDLLEEGDSPPPVSGEPLVDGMPADAFSMGRFGYFVFDRRGDEWVGGFHDLSDRLVNRCRLRGRVLKCIAAPGADPTRR